MKEEQIEKQFNDYHSRTRRFDDMASIASAVEFVGWSIFQATRLVIAYLKSTKPTN